MRTTMEANHESRQREQQLLCRYAELIRLCIPLVHSFIACGRTRGPRAPANLKGFNLLETEGDTRAEPE